jgi:L-threonylcarbamoyladenylate synthase
MSTALARTETAALLEETARMAAELLRAGEPVALPTETVYGLAADALRPEAVAKIFAAKERPFFDPLICHLPEVDWLERLAGIPVESRDLVERLRARFWPGPLTLVLPKQPIVPDLVTAGLATVAVRMSAHRVFQAVARTFGGPLAAPSANRFGRISPTRAGHVLAELDGRIPLVVDGGPTAHGLESTIVQVDGERLRLLRAGPISAEALAAFAPVSKAVEGKLPTAPGQLKSHYAPRTPLRIVEHFPDYLRGADLAVLSWRGVEKPERFGAVEILSETGDFVVAAATLFDKMRRLDDAGFSTILAEPVPEQGLGHAIMDRLRKAQGAGGSVVS